MNLFKLIAEVSAIDQKSPKEELIRQVAGQLRRQDTERICGKTA